MVVFMHWTRFQRLPGRALKLVLLSFRFDLMIYMLLLWQGGGMVWWDIPRLAMQILATAAAIPWVCLASLPCETTKIHPSRERLASSNNSIASVFHSSAYDLRHVKKALCCFVVVTLQ